MSTADADIPFEADLAALAPPILVASHQRSGTHLTMDLIRRHCPPCKPRMRPLERLHDSYLSIDRFWSAAHNPVSQANALRILRKADRQLLKTHARPGFEEVAPEHAPFVRAIVRRAVPIACVRDGRKVMCSQYAWAKSFMGDARGTFDEFLRQPSPDGLTRPAAWARHVNQWADAEGVLVVKFEDTVAEPIATVRRIAQHAGLDVRPREPALPRPIMSRWQSALARALGRIESTNIHSGGETPMKPAEAFTPDDNALFDREAGDAMARLGYA
ncbi:MAG: sulfotransferase [Planctomycetota bacterium]